MTQKTAAPFQKPKTPNRYPLRLSFILLEFITSTTLFKDPKYSNIKLYLFISSFTPTMTIVNSL